MTDEAMNNYQPPPQGGGDDDSRSSEGEQPPTPPLNRVVDGEGGDATGEPDANPETPEPLPEQGSHTREEVASPEDAEPEPGPEDWEPFTALTEDELLRLLAQHKDIENAHNRQGWLHRMKQLPIVRALYSKMRGTRFEKAVKVATGIGKTQAYSIVTYLYAEPQNVPEIWEKVLAEAHQAQVKGDAYEYPSLSKMIGWYKPPKEDGKNTDESDDADDTGGNDPRSKGAIIRSEMGLKDRVLELARDLAKAQERISSRDRDYDVVSAQASEREQKLKLARELILKQKRDAESLQAERDKAAIAALAEKDAEITRLQALIPPPPLPPDPPINNNHALNSDGPAEQDQDQHDQPKPETPDAVKQLTIGDVLHTRDDIDPKWGANTRPGGTRMPDYAHIMAVRNACYALLHHEPDHIAHAAKEVLNARTPTFFRQVTLNMDLATITALPNKPQE